EQAEAEAEEEDLARKVVGPKGAPSDRCPRLSEPSLPEHRAVASQPGDGDRERLPQASQTGEGRPAMLSRQPEPPDSRIAAIPADDLPRNDIGDGRPSDAQLIACR